MLLQLFQKRESRHTKRLSGVLKGICSPCKTGLLGSKEGLLFAFPLTKLISITISFLQFMEVHNSSATHSKRCRPIKLDDPEKVI